VQQLVNCICIIVYTIRCVRCVKLKLLDMLDRIEDEGSSESRAAKRTKHDEVYL
jgi:hypothetical protein